MRHRPQPVSAMASAKPPQTTVPHIGVSTRRVLVVAHVLGDREGGREAEAVAHEHEGAVQVLAGQVGQADGAQAGGDAEGDPDLGLPGLGVVVDRGGCSCGDPCRVVEGGPMLRVWQNRVSIPPEEGCGASGPPVSHGGTFRGHPSMSTTHDLVTALKAELKAAGLTYADLAAATRHGRVQHQAHLRARATCRCRASTRCCAC